MEMGFEVLFLEGENLNRKEVIKAVKSIRNKHQKKFPGLKLDPRVLQFDSKVSFAKSFLLMVRQMDVSQKKKKR